MKQPRIEPTAIVDGSELVGDVRVFDTSTVWRCKVAATGDGQVVIADGSTIDNVNVTVTDGQIQFRHAVVSGDGDWFTVRPDGDPLLWTAHLSPSGWIVHAGCVRGVAADGSWDASSAPDDPDGVLTAARQAAYLEVCAEADQRG